MYYLRFANACIFTFVTSLSILNGVSGQAEEQKLTKELPASLRPHANPPKELAAEFGEFRSPLLRNDGTRITTANDWMIHRGDLRDEWHQMLGPWPELITNPKVVLLESKNREHFRQHKIRFKWTPTEETTGYLLLPKGKGPFPGVICVYYEPETGIGLGKEYRDFAYQLTKRGFATLSIGTTDATEAKTYSLYYPSIKNAKVQPLSMLGYAAANAYYVLAKRPEIDEERIGIVGHSFGGKWAMFASCLFDKFACAVWSDPGIVFEDSRPSINYWEPWYLGYHPKPWRKRGLITQENPGQGLYVNLRKERRNLHELHALMAPRPFLVSGGSEDPVQQWKALNHTVAVNRVLGYKDRVLMTNRPDHSPNRESNAVIYSFFEHFLEP